MHTLSPQQQKSKQRQRQLMANTVNNALRLEAVRQTRLLDTATEESFDRLTRLAASLLNKPASFVNLIVEDRDFIKSFYGLPEPLATDRNIRDHPSFCQHIISHRQPLVVNDARQDHLFADFPSVKNMGVIAYAGIPLIDENNYAIGTCCVFDFKPHQWTDREIMILTEIAASVMTEIKLRKMSYQLNEESHAKDTFIMTASHELNTPITSLQAFTQIYARQYHSAGQTEVALKYTQMHQQVQKLSRLVSRMLDADRIHQGQLQLDTSSHSLTKIVLEIIEEIQPIADRKIEFSSTAKNDNVLVDHDRITQVLTNLIMNAIHYSESDSPVKITISQNNVYAKVAIRDYGLGIPEEILPKIFDRFYRAESSPKAKHNGLGLGLYLSQQIVIQHQGRLSVTSQLGKGSIFSVQLPLAPRSPLKKQSPQPTKS